METRTEQSTLEQLADHIFAVVRSALGEVWDQAIGPADRELIRACCADAAELELKAMALPRTNETRRALMREKAQINAQLSNLAAAEQGRVARAFWQAVRRAANRAVAIAVAVI